MSKILITRVESFSASHRLNSPHLSLDENRQIFGKCNNPNGHGHNYKLEVSVEGNVDPITGMVINLTDLKDIIKVTVLDVFDHTNLDLDHPHHFSNIPRYKYKYSIKKNIFLFSTTENFLLVISNELKKEFLKRFPNNQNSRIRKIVLWETEKNIFTIEF